MGSAIDNLARGTQVPGIQRRLQALPVVMQERCEQRCGHLGGIGQVWLGHQVDAQQVSVSFVVDPSGQLHEAAPTEARALSLAIAQFAVVEGERCATWCGVVLGRVLRDRNEAFGLGADGAHRGQQHVAALQAKSLQRCEHVLQVARHIDRFRVREQRLDVGRVQRHLQRWPIGQAQCQKVARPHDAIRHEAGTRLPLPQGGIHGCIEGLATLGQTGVECCQGPQFAGQGFANAAHHVAFAALQEKKCFHVASLGDA